jgi:hypothetical protein
VTAPGVEYKHWTMVVPFVQGASKGNIYSDAWVLGPLTAISGDVIGLADDRGNIRVSLYPTMMAIYPGIEGQHCPIKFDDGFAIELTDSKTPVL